MTVKELKRELNKLPSDLEILTLNGVEFRPTRLTRGRFLKKSVKHSFWNDNGYMDVRYVHSSPYDDENDIEHVNEYLVMTC